MQSLKTSTTKGIAWSAVGTFSVQGASFVIGIILARVLMPSDYGLIGMLAIFIAISQLFIESGFTSALIQKIDRTETDYYTVFYFNLFVSILFYFLLFFSAPLISKFYQVPELTLLTRVLALNFVINSLSIVQQTRCTVILDFKTPAIISFISVVISGLLGVFMAFSGFGVWSLVIQSISAAFVRSSLFFLFSKWYPRFIFSTPSFKALYGFSSKIFAANFIATIVNNLYTILIGKVFSAKDLGFYTRAKQFPELMSNTVYSILQNVTYPVLASLQNDRERMISVYGRLMRVTVIFVMPFLTLFALLSEPFIRFFLTEKWMPAVSLMQWLCFARMITPISALNLGILKAIGRSDLFFKVDVSKLPLSVVGLLVTIPFGLKAVVIGHFIISFLCFFINAYYPGKMFGFGALRQIKEMKFVAIAVVVMSICVFGVKLVLTNDLLQLVVGGTVGVISFLVSSYLLKIEELNEFKIVALQLFAKNRSNKNDLEV